MWKYYSGFSISFFIFLTILEDCIDQGNEIIVHVGSDWVSSKLVNIPQDWFNAVTALQVAVNGFHSL